MTPGTDSGPAALVGDSRRLTSPPPGASWPNRSASRLVIAGERRWHVQETGEGPPLLLLHGTGSSAHSWRDLIPRLATDFRVLAPDLPGHARTERLRGERLSLDDMARALGELLTSIGFDPNVVVGHSAGAAIGLRMALDKTISPAVSIGVNAALLPYGGAWQPVIAPIATLCASLRWVPRVLAAAARDPESVRRMIESTGSDLDDEGLELYRALLRSEEHVAAVLSMMASWNLDRFLAELPRLEGRLHLMTSANDLAVKPEQADRIKRIAPFTDVVPVRGGHLAHEEYPDEFARLIARLGRPGPMGHEQDKSEGFGDVRL